MARSPNLPRGRGTGLALARSGRGRQSAGLVGFGFQGVLGREMR